MAALASIARAEQAADPISGGKSVYFHQESQLIQSAQAFDTKSGARKPAAAWSPLLAGDAGRTFDLNPGAGLARRSAEEMARTLLSGLSAIRGRAPPVAFCR